MVANSICIKWSIHCNISNYDRITITYKQTQVLKILISNAVSSVIVIFIQLVIIGFVQFSFLGNKDFELIILDELKNKL